MKLVNSTPLVQSSGLDLVQYQIALSSVGYNVDIELDREAPDLFQGELRRKVFGPLSIVKAHANNSFSFRRKRPEGASVQNIILKFQQSGSALHHCRNTEFRNDEGGFVLIDPNTELGGQQIGRADALLVNIPRGLLKGLVGNYQDYLSIPIDANSGSTALLVDFIGHIWLGAGSYTVYEQKLLPETFVKLVGIAFKSRLEGTSHHDQDIGVQYQRLKKAIYENIYDSELSVSHLARILGMSRSSLYSITRAAGTSVGKLIMDIRLEKAKELLENPGSRHMTISDIAFHLGFEELSHFSRRFKQKYGASPRSHRQALSEAGNG